MKNRLLALRLPRKRYPAEEVERYIYYSGYRHDLTDEQFEDLLSSIPEVWNTPKDQLIHFVWFEDKTFSCNKEKTVFNFSRRDVEVKKYFFDAVTQEQVDELILICIDFINKIKLQNFDNLYDDIIDSLSDLSYMKEKILLLRNISLKDSDYMFNTDYKFSSSEDEEKWKKYRQEWRDITEQDFWKNNDFCNLQIPISPSPREQIPSVSRMINNSIVSSEIPQDVVSNIFTDEDYTNVLKNYGSIVFKIEVLKTLASLNLPMGFESATTVRDLESQISSSLQPLEQIYLNMPDASEIEEFSNMWQRQLKNVDDKIKTINDEFKKYNLNFTIGDIINQFVEETKKKVENTEKNKEAVDLINDILAEGVQ